jgi:hypothetical protein
MVYLGVPTWGNQSQSPNHTLRDVVAKYLIPSAAATNT